MEISAYDAHIQEQYIAIYDMSDFSNTKKLQKNKNRQVSFFVKYVLIYLDKDLDNILKRAVTFPTVIIYFQVKTK